MITKKCLHCGRQFTKKVKLSKTEWFNRKFCSKICHNKSKIGKKASEKTKEKMRGKTPWNKGLTGLVSWNKGLKYTDEQKKKLNLSGLELGHLWNKGTKGICKPNSGSFTTEKISGEKHPNWLGGITLKKYSKEWNKQLRISVRERDNYICQLCGDKQDTRAFSVHHIDYDKFNCSNENLVSLCVKCHAKTNFKRKYWKEYFTNLMKNICL